jgi:hypothetical protein
MSNSQFSIDILDLYWINGEKDNPEDLCLHGDVNVIIGEEVVAESYSCTVSSTALYLLKSLELEHIIGEENQMLPCCGHFIIPNDTDDTVEISGCGHGIDWSVLHIGGYVKLVTEKGNDVSIELDTYTEIVFNFVGKIEGFYKKCQEKSIPTDDFDREGYIKFWREWNNRRYPRSISK